LATFIAFPVAVYTLFSRKDNLIPFGPFLAMAAILIHISKVDISEILNFFSK
jgi:prepilin signal peptidase PulO-like enzyme (type II secretory pathway)